MPACVCAPHACSIPVEVRRGRVLEMTVSLGDDGPWTWMLCNSTSVLTLVSFLQPLLFLPSAQKKPKNIPMPLALSGLVVPPKVLGNSKVLMTAAPNSEEAEVLVGHFLAWLSAGEKTYPLNNMDKPTFWKLFTKGRAFFLFLEEWVYFTFLWILSKLYFFHYITELGPSFSPCGSISLSLNNESSSPRGNSNLIIHHPPSYRLQGLVRELGAVLGHTALTPTSWSWPLLQFLHRSSPSLFSGQDPTAFWHLYLAGLNSALQTGHEPLPYSPQARHPLLPQPLLCSSSVGWVWPVSKEGDTGTPGSLTSQCHQARMSSGLRKRHCLKIQG